MLFLLTIGFFAGIPIMLLLIIQNLNMLFFSGRIPVLTPLLILELFVGFLIFIYSIIVAINYFMKRQRAPRMIISLILANFVFQAIIFFVAKYIISLPSQLIVGLQNELLIAIIAGVIYVPYLLSSKKVREIFVT